MLPPPTHHCYHRHHHAATAFPNVLMLWLKLHFCQAAASAAKLATAIVLPPLPPLPTRGNRRTTTAYKINKKRNTIDYPFFHHDGNDSTQQRLRSHETTAMAMLLFTTTYNTLMLRSDESEASSHIENKNEMTEHTDTKKILIIQLLLEKY